MNFKPANNPLTSRSEFVKWVKDNMEYRFYEGSGSPDYFSFGIGLLYTTNVPESMYPEARRGYPVGKNVPLDFRNWVLNINHVEVKAYDLIYILTHPEDDADLIELVDSLVEAAATGRYTPKLTTILDENHDGSTDTFTTGYTDAHGKKFYVNPNYLIVQPYRGLYGNG